MSFQFLVKRGGHLPVANVWLLDGVLLSGKVGNNTTATAETEQGTVKIQVKTVAFLNQKSPNPSELTLTVEKPSCEMESLEGKVLVAA